MARKVRLPSYLVDQQVWIDLADVIDDIFEGVDNPIKQLVTLRDVNNIHPDRVEEKVGRSMLNPADRWNAGNDLWRDRFMRVQQANTIGWNFFNSSFITDDNYDQFIKQAVAFYPEKGTPSFVDFLGFCLNAYMYTNELWTKDYVNFYVEEEAKKEAGFNPVYSGGEWYPTTHIELSIEGDRSNPINQDDLIDLFYYISPINLVLSRIAYVYFAQMYLYTGGACQIDVLPDSYVPDNTLNVAMAGQVEVAPDQLELNTLNVAIAGSIDIVDDPGEYSYINVGLAGQLEVFRL